MDERLDEQKLAQLRGWAEGLLNDPRPDMRAAARGLLLLADEVERLWLTGRDAFAGDAIATWPSVMPGWPAFNLNERQHRASLRRLAEVEPALVGVGHGEPIAHEARKRVRDLVDALGR